MYEHFLYCREAEFLRNPEELSMETLSKISMTIHVFPLFSFLMGNRAKKGLLPSPQRMTTKEQRYNK